MKSETIKCEDTIIDPAFIDPALKIGVIGSGRGAGRFMRESGAVPRLQVPCVYHPFPEQSDSLRRFLESHESVAECSSLESLFEQIDAVYIASPHETHYEYAKAALKAGRHVLCEKPMAFGRQQAEELFALAEAEGLVLMEGIKTAYCPGFIQLMELAASGVIGEIVNVDSCFTRLTPPGLREWTDLKYGGSFTELGSYVILPIVKLLGADHLEWTFRSVCNEDGLDRFTSIDVTCAGRMAAGRCGIGAKAEGQMIITGTKGYILAEAPWWQTRRFEIRYEDPDVREAFTAEYAGEGLRYEITAFLKMIRGQSEDSGRLTKEESICMAEIFRSFLEWRAKNAV